jgi:hypothetical protein
MYAEWPRFRTTEEEIGISHNLGERACWSANRGTRHLSPIYATIPKLFGQATGDFAKPGSTAACNRKLFVPTASERDIANRMTA